MFQRNRNVTAVVVVVFSGILFSFALFNQVGWLFLNHDESVDRNLRLSISTQKSVPVIEHSPSSRKLQLFENLFCGVFNTCEETTEDDNNSEEDNNNENDNDEEEDPDTDTDDDDDQDDSEMDEDGNEEEVPSDQPSDSPTGMNEDDEEDEEDSNNTEEEGGILDSIIDFLGTLFGNNTNDDNGDDSGSDGESEEEQQQSRPDWIMNLPEGGLLDSIFNREEDESILSIIFEKFTEQTMNYTASGILSSALLSASTTSTVTLADDVPVLDPTITCPNTNSDDTTTTTPDCLDGFGSPGFWVCRTLYGPYTGKPITTNKCITVGSFLTNNDVCGCCPNPEQNDEPVCPGDCPCSCTLQQEDNNNDEDSNNEGVLITVAEEEVTNENSNNNKTIINTFFEERCVPAAAAVSLITSFGKVIQCSTICQRR